MSNLKRYDGSNWQPIEIDADKLGGKMSSSFQDKLVSGTNIKTVNGSSLLGSGDVTISAQDSRYFKHWYGMFVCPSDTYYYRLIAKATNSGSDTRLYQTITIRGTIGGWGSSEQCEFMYIVALRDNTFSTANNIRKTIFRGTTYTTESTIASNTGIDIVTHRDSSSGALYIYLRSYGTQKYSQYNIIVTANGQEGVVELPTDENFYTLSSGTLVSGSQLLSSTTRQCIEITNKNLKTVNGNNLMGNGNLNIGLQMTNSYSGNVCFYARPSWDTTMTQIYSSFSSYTPYIVLPYQMPWFYLTWGTTDEWPSMCFLERISGYIFHFRFYRNGSPMEYQNINVQSQVVRFGSCKIFKLI